MTAKFSSIDDETMSEWQGPYVLAFVVNKRQESSCILYNKEPVPVTLEVPTKIIWDSAVNKAALIKEFDEKVTEVATPTILQFPGYGNYHNTGYSEYYNAGYKKSKQQDVPNYLHPKKSFYFEDDEDTEESLCDWCGCKCTPDEKNNCMFILKLRAGHVDEAVEDMLHDTTEAMSDEEKEFEKFRQEYITG
jgi:hypothetical protein